MSQVNPEPYRLSYDDAVDVWTRYLSGEFQHHIAASYGVNPGRVSDVLKGRKHPGSETDARSRRSAA
jgi:hypothetical protein